MKAELTNTPSKFNPNHRKENYYAKSYLLIDPASMNAVEDARFYNTNSTTYACLWISGQKAISGTGKAGGGGYHKASAALEEAINNAGYKLDQHIDGAGDKAMEEALKAIAEAEGFKDCKIFVAHG